MIMMWHNASYVLYTRIQFCDLKRHNFDRKALLSNFKAVGQTLAELHSLKDENLDACIRPLFANLVTYVIYIIADCRYLCTIKEWIGDMVISEQVVLQFHNG